MLTFLLKANPAEQIQKRTKQLIEFSRYARVGVPGELLGWEDVDVVRFNELYRALDKLGNEEGTLKAALESF
jgi:hypothetical protein